MTTENKCEGCPDINCLSCLPDDKTKCTTCATKYYLLTDKCITCDVNCKKCDTPGHCVECNTGYFNKNGACIANNISSCLV